MPSTSAREIQKLVAQSEHLTFVYVSVFAALTYHYLTTVDEEVKYIWPQPRWKLGKILFLTTRYGALISMAAMLVYNFRNYAKLGTTGCYAMFDITQVSIAVNTTCNEVILWLCLYALLGGKPRYFYMVVALLLGFAIPAYVLQCLHLFSHKALSPTPLDLHLGYPCAWTPKEIRYKHAYSIGGYILVARSLVAIILGLVTLVVRYRRQRNRLLRAIVQEGGLYLALTLVLRFISAVAMTPKTPIKDTYDIMWGLNRVFGNVFAERLLLSLRKVDDPGTRAVISSLAFNIPPEDSHKPGGFDLPERMDDDREGTADHINNGGRSGESSQMVKR